MEVNYEIKEQIGVLHTTPGGWTLEANFMSWNGGAPKIDIRSWLHSGDKMSKGVTMTANEARELVKVLSSWLADHEEDPDEKE